MYLVKQDEPIKGSFITYNSYTGEIGTSEKLSTEPNMNSFPVIEIKKQDLITPGTFETLKNL
jgi:hypothetical protein